MASQGPLSPATLVDDASTGTIAWSNPGNAAASDNVYANASDAGSGGNTHYLKVTNFGFTIPSGATILGIQVDIERRASGAGVNAVRDANLRLAKPSGFFGTTNKADTASNWPTSDTVTSYGGAADLWGEVLTDTDINSALFGVGISANLIVDTSVTAFVDQIRMTVTYADAFTTSTSSTSSSTSISTSTSSTSTSQSTSTSSTSSSTSVSTSTSSTSSSTSRSTSTSSTSSSISTSVSTSTSSTSTSTTVSLTTSTSSTSSSLSTSSTSTSRSISTSSTSSSTSMSTSTTMSFTTSTSSTSISSSSTSTTTIIEKHYPYQKPYGFKYAPGRFRR